MPNNAYFDKAKKRAQLAIKGLLATQDLGFLVTRIDGNQFVGALGDTVYHKMDLVTRARKYEFRTRSAPIIMDEIFSNEIGVLLDTHTYSGNKFTDEEERLDLTSYAQEILRPQIKAVTRDLNSDIRLKLTTETNFKVTDLDADGDESALDWALDAQATLDAIGMPDDVRYLLVGSNAHRWLAKSGELLAYDKEAAVNVFRRGIVGTIAGFTVVKRADLDANAIYAVHPSWAVMANVAPIVPDGAAWGAQARDGGYGIRVIRDYDPNYLSDRSIVSTFTGITTVKDEVEIHTSATATSDNTNFGDNAKAGDLRFDFSTKRLKLTGKSVRAAKGTFTPGTGS